MAEAASKPKIVTLEILEYYHERMKATFVEKEAGKGLSSNDFTAALKSKLESIVTDPGDEYVTTEDIDALFEDDEETADAGAGEGSAEGGGTSLDDQDGPTE